MNGWNVLIYFLFWLFVACSVALGCGYLFDRRMEQEPRQRGKHRRPGTWL